MKIKSTSDSRSVENISNKRLRIEFQLAQTNRVERVKRFANVYSHCIISNLKRISKILTLHLLQPLRWCCVHCVIRHKRDVREEQQYMYVARTSLIE